jgi:hypothetical protein
MDINSCFWLAMWSPFMQTSANNPTPHEYLFWPLVLIGAALVAFVAFILVEGFNENPFRLKPLIIWAAMTLFGWAIIVAIILLFRYYT